MKPHQDQLADIAQTLAGREPEEILLWAESTFEGTIAFATSLGAEDQVLTAMIAGLELDVPLFTLDTGRLFPECYDLIERTRQRYGIDIRMYSPDARELEALVYRHGPNAFRRRIELRRRCCEVRKLRPLQRALDGRDAWICGLRREQAATRLDVGPVQWDAQRGMVKVNPLADWSEADVWEYIHQHSVPYNPLHDQGFRSIGCACCTRAIAPGDDVRAGRWWWEQPEQRECGLHLHTDPDGRVRIERSRGALSEPAQ